jgi:hypothetical protein
MSVLARRGVLSALRPASSPSSSFSSLVPTPRTTPIPLASCSFSRTCSSLPRRPEIVRPACLRATTRLPPPRTTTPLTRRALSSDTTTAAASSASPPSSSSAPASSSAPHESENSVRRKEERRPWHRARDEADKKDEHYPLGSEGDASTGRILTTPTRLLKLILPIPLHPDHDTLSTASDETLQSRPLALVVHPQQPLSYVAGLIQAELPPLKTPDGATHLPAVHFRAIDVDEPTAPASFSKRREETRRRAMDRDDASNDARARHADTSSSSEENWVRWSGSTEVGDFIRDAARGGAFVVDIEGLSPEDADLDGRRDVGGVRVAVPSFGERTWYMRRRLRAMAARVEQMAQIKNECDLIAHRGAHRIAKAGFVVTGGWWVLVYYATFHTNLTWDFMEPVTYLAGLIIMMAGYWYFLYVSRDLSYKAALRTTVSRRRNALYAARGFDLDVWQKLVHDANALRAEIRLVADEYAVEWDELRELGSDEIRDALEGGAEEVGTEDVDTDDDKKNTKKKKKNGEGSDDD